MIAALALAAMSGAWVQSRLVPAPAMSPQQTQALDSRLDRESALIRDSVAGLAAKLGELQARLIAVEGVRQRVAEAAGLAYTDPEIAHGIALPDSGVMDDIPVVDLTADSAEVLGRELDVLRQRVTAQEDAYSLMDLAMSRRAGIEESLPTYSPVTYPYLSSSFGWRSNPVTGRHSMHEGLDFAAPRGTPIRAASGGVVERAGYVGGYGRMVVLDHGNGIQTRYAHASSLSVKAGDLVHKGQVIGKVGSTGRSTGPHLHFEVRMAGHPLDPTLFLPAPEPETHRLTDASGALDAGASELR